MGRNSRDDVTGLGEDCPYAAAAVLDYLIKNNIEGCDAIRRRATRVLKNHPDIYELLQSKAPASTRVRYKDGSTGEIDISGTVTLKTKPFTAEELINTLQADKKVELFIGDKDSDLEEG